MRDDDCDKVLQIQLDFEFKHVPKLYGKKRERRLRQAFEAFERNLYIGN